MERRQVICSILATLLAEQGRAEVRIADSSPMHEGGLGFDSLTTAQLSALLEERFGTDPYTAGIYPPTVGDLLAFYA